MATSSSAFSDDLIAWLSDTANTVNVIRKGQLVVGISDGRLLTVATTNEQRVGYEIKREVLLQDVPAKMQYNVGR
jgi:hypothetical protein